MLYLTGFPYSQICIAIAVLLLLMHSLLIAHAFSANTTLVYP
jgi:hypothetical protein